ncbi:hypothetical protein CMI37_03200 [Candidatus Pacearchaeota archaeon]|nr:hypothetical protein [Candidatus Pacearchaeota archaeon]
MAGILKAEEENGQWVIYVGASDESRDQEKERIEVSALKKAADYYVSHGVISWDHKHKPPLNDPKFIIGEPTDVRFSADNQTLVKGFLYQQNDIAVSVWKNVRSGAQRLGGSVGGGVLKKSDDDSIQRVVWDDTAITYKPVNDAMYGLVSFVPFAEFAKAIAMGQVAETEGAIELEIEKALMAGSGVDAGSFTGGRALTGEALRGKPIYNEFPGARALFRTIMAKVLNGSFGSWEEISDFVEAQGFDPHTTVELLGFLGNKLNPALRDRK